MRRWTLLFLAMLSACGWKPFPDVPIWFESREYPGYEGDRYLTGIAMGPWLGGRNTAQVEVRAKADLAAQVEATVKSRLTSYLASDSTGDGEELAARFRSTATQETSLLLTDVRRVTAESDQASDTVFVCVVLDREAAARRFMATITDQRRRIDSLEGRSRDFRDHLLMGQVRHLAQQKIDLEVLKGRLYCGDLFTPGGIEVGSNPVAYNLNVLRLPEPEKAWMPALLTDAFRDYGIVFEEGAERQLTASCTVSEAPGFKWPTMQATVELHETIEGRRRLVWSLALRAAHPKSLERARELLRARAGEALRDKLAKEIDERARRLVGDAS